MRNTFSVRLDDDLAAWLEQAAASSGRTQGDIVREQLREARRAAGGRSFMKLAGVIRGARDLSQRKGFARS